MNISRCATVALLSLVGAMSSLTAGHATKLAKRPARFLTEQSTAVGETLHSVRRYFEANVGQAPAGVDYLVRGNGRVLALTRRGIVLTSQQTPQHAGPVQVTWRGAAPDVAVEGVEPVPTVISYFVGNDPRTWHTHVPAYSRVRYRSIYPGIDLVYRHDGNRLEYDFVVEPGGRPELIALDVEHADATMLEQDGSVSIVAGKETIRQLAPRVWEETPGGRVSIAARYAASGTDGSIRFVLGDHDPAHRLVIDPTIEYTATLGGSANETANGIVVDGSGNSYVVGYTNSPDLPVSRDAFQRTRPGNTNVFVAKLNRDGNSFAYVTYLGGRGQRPSSRIPEQGTAIAVDASGNAIVTGYTSSTDFPTVNAVESSALGAEIDAFVTKIRADGAALVYSTYLGARDGVTDATSIALGPAGDAYVGGSTTGAQFTTTTDLSVASGTGRVFLVRLNPAGGRMSATRLGGTKFTLDVDHLRGVARDGSGNVYLAGTAHSRDFPTANAFQAECPTRGTDCSAAFLTKLDAGGSRILFSTFLGGSVRDYGAAVAVGPDNTVYLTGTTQSPDFPIRDATQPNFGGGDSDVYLSAFTPNGALISSTYLGGSWDEGFVDRDPRVAVDASGRVYVSAYTGSVNFPTRNSLIAVHPQGPVFRSIDRGGRWTNASRGLTSSVLDLAVDPTDVNTAYAATYDGIFGTTDGGATWQPRNTGLPFRRGRAIWTVAVDPRQPSVVYTASADGLDGLYKSVDRGATWTLLDRATPSWFVYRHSLVIAPYDSNVLFLASVGIRKSTDGGRTWSDSSTGLPRCFGLGSSGPCTPRAIAIEPYPPYALYAAQSEGIFKSDDGGATWRNVSGRFFNTPSVEVLAIDPRVWGRVYAATSRFGVVKTADGGGTWDGMNFPFASATELAIDIRSRALYAVAGPDATPHVWKSEGSTWKDVGLPGSSIRVLAAAPEYRNADVVYAAGFLFSLPFLTQFTPPRQTVGYSTYLPDGSPHGLAVDAIGNAYLLLGDFEVVIRKVSPLP